MWQYALKIAITSVVIVAISEIAKRNSFWAAVLASLPLTSLLAFAWIYLESRSAERVAVLSHEILWLVIPSMLLFVALPMLLRAGMNFWLSLGVSCVLTAVAYGGMVWLLGRIGARL